MISSDDFSPLMEELVLKVLFYNSVITLIQFLKSFCGGWAGGGERWEETTQNVIT